MCKSLSSLKKRTVEIDFGKCLLSQFDEIYEYQKPNVKTVQRVIDLANERKIYKYDNCSEFCKRILKDGYTAESLVIENNCVFIIPIMQIFETRQNETEVKKKRSYSCL